MRAAIVAWARAFKEGLRNPGYLYLSKGRCLTLRRRLLGWP